MESMHLQDMGIISENAADLSLYLPAFGTLCVFRIDPHSAQDDMFFFPDSLFDPSACFVDLVRCSGIGDFDMH